VVNTIGGVSILFPQYIQRGSTVKLSKRVENLPPYLFVQISKKISAKKAKGEEVISFGIGDPDIPTPDHIIDELCRSARIPANHRYPETEGLPELRKAIANCIKHVLE
jgi:LL-diaminopimelate aminotransferase